MVRRNKRWSLLSSHGLVLVTVSRYGSITVPEIGQRTHLSRASALRVLRDLQDAGMLQTSQQGRRNVYHIRREVSFRHPVLKDSHIGDLLKAFPQQNR